MSADALKSGGLQPAVPKDWVGKRLLPASAVTDRRYRKAKYFARNRALKRLGFRSTRWMPAKSRNTERPFEAIETHLK